ncbi:Venom carboxylesterase-6 [Cryptotermes secundus]|uniref:Carboxylic ester hydrolase n=1 Tax=Cryptotermes secundus TaxID=105785 RepID=A0A2J7QJG9_9NEOP|nr:venom carboxylesterase-6 [Cryptotermes secundus]PNF28712.1 Venom carboxylesterase-6 [Cryptotermes secundus]
MLGQGLLLVTAVLVSGAVPPQVGPLVHVEQGALRGTHQTSAGGRIFSAFQGIPYARPPTGKHRFKDPAPMKPWRGVWPAITPGSKCLQYDPLTQAGTSTQASLQGDEDCLYLNVYSPMLPAGGGAPLLDVIVNIHGGGFSYGAGSKYGPKYLLDGDVILVTFNYRLGPLGFLSTEDEVVPGNMGLKDQTAALRWVQRNIASFGGNPASVTLTGQSAGGVSVHYHYLSPLSHGLFQRGISQSGTALNPWAQMENGRGKATKLAQQLGCSIQTSREMVDCLRHRPASMIAQQVATFQEWRNMPFSPFGFTVEVAGVTPFLSRQPTDMLLDGSVQDLPWITSVTTEEGLYPAADWVASEEILNELQTRFAEVAPHILDYNYTVADEQKQAVAQSIHQFYLHGKAISTETTSNIIQMTGDRHFVVEAERAARLQAAVNSEPVYFYQFGYRGKHSLSEVMSGTNINFGVSHGDDAAYVLQVPYSNIEETQQDKDMSKVLTDIWDSFHRTGNPVTSGRNFTWEPVTANCTELAYLYITNSSHLEMRSSLDLGHREFWDSLPISEPQRNVNIPNVQHPKHHEL